MTRLDPSSSGGLVAGVGVSASAAPDQRQPSGVDEAFSTLDRIARYCVFTCATDSNPCIGARCLAWNLEHAAADWLQRRWLDGQD